MDIQVYRDGFAVAAIRQDFKYKWVKPNNLKIWELAPQGVHVQAHPGIFVEAVNKAGDVVCDGGDGQMLYVPPIPGELILRIKKLPTPSLSKSQLEKLRGKVTRYLVCDAPYSLHIPDSMDGVIQWMKKKLQAIPKHARKTARFRFDTENSYGETYPRIEITYSEAETDAELTDRLKIEAERDRLNEVSDRQRLIELKRKYCKQDA